MMARVQTKKGIDRRIKWTDEMMCKEADFLVEWAHGDHAICLGTCYGLRGYSYEKASRWAERCEWCAEDIE